MPALPRPPRLQRLVTADGSHRQMQLIPRTRLCVPIWPVCMLEAGRSSVEGCAYRTGTLYSTPTGRREGVRCRVCGQVLLPLQLATRAANSRNCTPEHNCTTALLERLLCSVCSLQPVSNTTANRNGCVSAEMMKGRDINRSIILKRNLKDQDGSVLWNNLAQDGTFGRP